MSYYGDIPFDFTCLVSCDSKYLEDHAGAFLASAAAANQPRVHLHVINPSAGDWAYMQSLRLLCSNIKITLSGEETDLSGLQDDALRTYYACNRFLVASHLLQISNVSLFICDIDCLILKPVLEPNADIGLFLRDSLPGVNEWEAAGSRVAAGCVYYSSRSQIFALEVENIIRSHLLVWFLDQFALNIAYEKNTNLRVHRYTETFMDWEFKENTNIWTGKGDRKYKSKIYLNKKNEFNRILQDKRERYWEV